MVHVEECSYFDAPKTTLSLARASNFNVPPCHSQMDEATFTEVRDDIEKINYNFYQKEIEKGSKKLKLYKDIFTPKERDIKLPSPN